MDRLTEMEAFATVIDQGGFTDAARKLGISKSAVSKHIASLEARLGARLLNRTTRRVTPTEIGLLFYDRARQVLSEAGEAERLVAALQAAPSGNLRVAVDADFGRAMLCPLIDAFLAAYPKLAVTLVLTEHEVDLVAEGFDVAVRVGELGDSNLRARKITTATQRLVASAGYLQRYGRPLDLDALSEHRLLFASAQASGRVWKLRAPSGETRLIRGTAPLVVNDAKALLDAAKKGLGIAYLPSFVVHTALKEGLVEEVLPQLPREVFAVQAVYPTGRFTLPKVRAFVDFLLAEFAGKGPETW